MHCIEECRNNKINAAYLLQEYNTTENKEDTENEWHKLQAYSAERELQGEKPGQKRRHENEA